MLQAIWREKLEYYTSRAACGFEPFSSGPFMTAGVDRNSDLDTGPGAPDLAMPK